MKSQDSIRVTQKKTTGIILAAGMSSRMGQAKQSLPFNGSTILGRVIKNAVLSNLDEVVVVLGHDFQSIKKEIAEFKIKVVFNPDYKNGQSSSLSAGINNITDSDMAAMFLLGDQPTIGISTINHILEAYQSSDSDIIIPTFNNKRGNPVIMTQTIFPYINKLAGDKGGRVLFETFKDVTLKVPIEDPNILLDIDTPDDYIRLTQKQ